MHGIEARGASRGKHAGNRRNRGEQQRKTSKHEQLTAISSLRALVGCRSLRKFGARHVDAHGLVSEADVEADTVRASLTEVVVRHERKLADSAGADTNLLECTVIGLSQDRTCRC